MRFMLFVCRDTVDPGPTAPEGAAVAAWVDRMDKSGRRVTGDPLAPEREAAAVRVRGGQVKVTDGAVLRTDDMLLGFDLLDCRDRAEAIAVAAEHPLAARGVLEIRALG